MIHRYSLETQRRWDRGEFKVRILVPGNQRPIAFCDGTDEDEVELRDIAEEEGADMPEISRRVLKTGREEWTLAITPPQDADEG